MTLQATSGHLLSLVSCLVSFTLWSGCSLQPLQQHSFIRQDHFAHRKDGSRTHSLPVHASIPLALESEVRVLDFGRIEFIPGRQSPGVVIGAPHGTFDFYTAGMVREICTRTGLAGVIATGFTPAESGDGRRINVNRPTERNVALSDREVETARSRTVYSHYRDLVLRAAQGNLALYIEIHQNNGSRIEVASVGFSKREASFIKDTYGTLRDRALVKHTNVMAVDLAIEPLDQIEVGAWAAKTNGILSGTHRSLHFELPSDGVMASSRRRAIYTSIVADFIRAIVLRSST